MEETPGREEGKRCRAVGKAEKRAARLDEAWKYLLGSVADRPEEKARLEELPEEIRERLLRLVAAQRTEARTVRAWVKYAGGKRRVQGFRVQREKIRIPSEKVVQRRRPWRRRLSPARCAVCDAELSGGRYAQSPVTLQPRKTLAWCRECYERLCFQSMRSDSGGPSATITGYDPGITRIVDSSPEPGQDEGANRLEQSTEIADDRIEPTTGEDVIRRKGEPRPTTARPLAALGIMPKNVVAAAILQELSAEELAWRRLIEQATPAKRARLHALPAAAREELLPTNGRVTKPGLLSQAVDLIRAMATPEQIQRLRSDRILKERVLHAVIDALP